MARLLEYANTQGLDIYIFKVNMPPAANTYCTRHKKRHNHKRRIICGDLEYAYCISCHQDISRAVSRYLVQRKNIWIALCLIARDNDIPQDVLGLLGKYLAWAPAINMMC